jgi:hypothetical protein
VNTVKQLYTRPYVVIFAASVALSAHGLFTAAVQLGRIVAWLAWLYVLIVDLLAVAAYRTWRQATESGRGHWAWAVAAAAAVGTVAMNTLASYPELAFTWVGPAIAGFPPVAALLATALRMAEQRLQVTVDNAADAEQREDHEILESEPVLTPFDPAPEPEPPVADPEPVTVERPAPRPVKPERKLTAIPAVTPARTDIDVAGIVADYLDLGGAVTDPELTAIVADELGCSDRTARRRLQPFRSEGVAA